MQITTCCWDADGWSTPLPRELDGAATLVLAFGSPDTPAGPFDDLRVAFPRSVIVGCSTAGQFVGAKLLDRSLVAAVVRFEHSRLAAASTPSTASCGVEDGEDSAGRALAAQLPPDGLRAVLVLSDGTSVNGSCLVRGLVSSLPREVVIAGGLAADGTRFSSTWVVDGGRTASGRVVAVGLYGDALRIGHGSRGGWDRFGPVRTVTRSRANVLYELDGRPALQLYKDYLGERRRELPSASLLFPLSLSEPGSDRTVVRTILSIDEAEQSMTFAGDVPTGARAQLMRANFERLIQGASDAAASSAARADAPSPAPPMLAIAVSCVGRRMVLRERVEEEIEANLESLPPGATQIGFYSYGEISPLPDGTCGLHNQTMTLMTVSEA